MTRTFKLSRDPNFVAKVEDIVGFYLDPPDKALVLSVDENRKSKRSTAPSPDCRFATHKTPAVKRWLKRHTRFHLHFTPTSGSWRNMVERFFAEITRKRIRRGVFKSVAELEQVIMDLENHNVKPKPFIWKTSARETFEKVAYAKQALESVH